MQRTSLKLHGRPASREVKRRLYLCNGRAINELNSAFKGLRFSDERIGPSTRHLAGNSSSHDDRWSRKAQERNAEDAGLAMPKRR